MDGVGGGPVGVGDRSQRVVRVELVGVEIVALLGHPDVRGRRIRDREEPAGVAARVLHFFVVEHHRVRLPLAADDVGHHPGRDVGIVAAARVSGRRRKIRGAVEEVHHVPHLGLVAGVEAWIVEVVAGRKFGPHSVHEVQDAVGVIEVPAAHRPVERGRQDGVDAQHVRVHRGDGVEPPRVQRRVGGELGRELAGEGQSHVHALHVEGPPAARRAQLEPVAHRARGEVEHRGAALHHGGRRALPLR